MIMIKIQIPDPRERARGFVEMGKRGRVICLPESVFIVPEPALELLRKLDVHFQELGLLEQRVLVACRQVVVD